jgi:ABC-type nitrate/sulfonate/bicarbonate transport system permease component
VAVAASVTETAVTAAVAAAVAVAASFIIGSNHGSQKTLKTIVPSTIENTFISTSMD